MKIKFLPIALLMVLGMASCNPSTSSSQPSGSSDQPSSETTSSEASSEEASSEESVEESTIFDVYFRAPDNWGTSINIYLWNDSGNLAEWPGTAMEHVTEKLYKFNYDTALYPNVIFNDGSNQTPDLTSPTSSSLALYVYGVGWVETGSEVNPEIQEAGWYIVGEGSFVNGQTWNVNGGIKMTVNHDYTGIGTEYQAIDVAFTEGDVWKLCSTENEWISNGWENESGALFSGDMALIDDGHQGNNVGVQTTGNYDIYFKVYGDGTYSCWISEVKSAA